MSWTSEFTKNGLYLALSNPLKATCFDLVDKATYTRNAVISNYCYSQNFAKLGNTIGSPPSGTIIILVIPDIAVAPILITLTQ